MPSKRKTKKPKNKNKQSVNIKINVNTNPGSSGNIHGRTPFQSTNPAHYLAMTPSFNVNSATPSPAQSNSSMINFSDLKTLLETKLPASIPQLAIKNEAENKEKLPILNYYFNQPLESKSADDNLGIKTPDKLNDKPISVKMEDVPPPPYSKMEESVEL
jgi:hypothetical protein